MRRGLLLEVALLVAAAALVQPPVRCQRRIVRRSVESAEEERLAACRAYLEAVGTDRWQEVLTRFDEQMEAASAEKFWPLTAETLVPHWREVELRRASEAWRRDVEEYAASLEEDREAMEFVASMPLGSLLPEVTKHGIPRELAAAGDNETRLETFILHEALSAEREERVRNAVRETIKQKLDDNGITLDVLRETLDLNETATVDQVLEEALKESPNFIVSELLFTVIFAIFAFGFFDAASSFFNFLGPYAPDPVSAPNADVFVDARPFVPNNPGEAGLNALLDAFQGVRK